MWKYLLIYLRNASIPAVVFGVLLYLVKSDLQMSLVTTMDVMILVITVNAILVLIPRVLLLSDSDDKANESLQNNLMRMMAIVGTGCIGLLFEMITPLQQLGTAFALFIALIPLLFFCVKPQVGVRILTK